MIKAISAIACVLLISTAMVSQTRSRTATRRGGQTARTSKASPQMAVRGEAASRVAEQIKNLTRFVYLLGGAARGIEQIDEAARKNEASPTALQQNEQAKASVKNSLRNVREGLDALEIYFRSTPELEQYYLRLAGSASGAASAEDLAAAGRFDRSGRALLDVVNRLTDTLLAMR